MRFLRSNTAVMVTVGPFYDKTDGVTIETALTITAERITLTADTDAGSAPTNILDNVTGATSGTSNDLNYITGNDAGMMQLELAAADTNRVGRMLLSVTDAANHVPVFHEFFVLPQAIYDWFTGVIVPLPANVTTWLGTAAATPTVAGVPEVDLTHVAGSTTSVSALASGVATVLADWNNGGRLDLILDIIAADTTTDIPALISTAATIADAVWDEDATGHQTGGTFGQAIGDPVADTNTIFKAVVTDATGATVGADIVAMKVDTAAILVDTGTTLDGRIPAALVSGRMDSSVGAMAANVLTATAINADAITDAKVASDVTIASVTGAVGSVTGAVGSVTGNVGGNVTGTIGGLTAAALKDFFDTDSATTYASAVAGSVVKEIADNAGGSALSEAGIAAAVWDMDATGHQTGGTFGQAIGDPVADTNTIFKAVVTDAAGATVGVDVVAVKADTAAILVDTGTTLDAALAVVDGNVDAILVDTAVIGALGAGLTAIPWNASWDAEVQSEATDALNAYDPPTNAELVTEINSVQTDVAAVKVDTAAILVDTGTTLDAALAVVDANVDAILVDTAEIGAAGAGLTNINLPNQTMDLVGNITGNLSGSVGSVTGAVGSVAAGGLSASSLAADAVDEILDEQIGDGTITMRQALRILIAGMAGKLSGAATATVTIRNLADSADVVVATVTADGNRTAVTVTP